MEITNEVKQRIVAAIAADRENYPSDNRHATALGIAPSVYNAIKRGNYEKQVSDANWVGIARRLGVQLRTEIPWLAAQTPTYVFVSKRLEVCQGSGLSAILCDMPNIGKTFTAKAYVKQHKHAVYVDCSQVKTKLKLIRYIAKEFGVTSNGRYSCLLYTSCAHQNPNLAPWDKAVLYRFIGQHTETTIRQNTYCTVMYNLSLIHI